MVFMRLKNILLTILPLTLFFPFTIPKSAFAQTKIDFVMDTDTTITYDTDNDFVTIENEYVRTVKNSNFFLTKNGRKTFHIPDLPSEIEKMKEERSFKLESLSVTDPKGIKIQYSIEELDSGEGIYIHIPYYRSTTTGSPLTIIMTYNTHDNLINSGGLTTIMASALPKDTVFQKTDETNNTTTQFNYNLSIITDKNIHPLARAFPNFTKEEKEKEVIYKFSQEERRGNPPTLEFGTTVNYKFEFEYKTPKTDHTIPEEYSNIMKAISTNIYELSLPREFDETNQKVLIEDISPLPTNIYRDQQGNVIAIFELPANREDVIKISGYISSKRSENSLNSNDYLNISFSDYLNKITSDGGNLVYLKSTNFWEVSNSYIQKTAKDLLAGKTTLLEILDADYQFVNDVLEYDESKANSGNERIGAVNALTGGASVCMEYADSMIALLRAQGIPARAALGYTNITDEATDLVRHQWVQIWIPDYGWFSIDPTYESSDRKMGELIDRVLWETFNEDSLSNISIFSADSISTFDESNYKIQIYSVKEIPENNLMSYEQILPEKDIDMQPEYSVGNWFNSFLKTTVVGRAILVTLPIATLIAIITIFLMVAKALIRRQKNKKQRLSKSV